MKGSEKMSGYLKLTQQEIEDFVVSNHEYYLKKWQKYPENSLFSGWNWVAFFFPHIWALYRKMYILLLLYAAYYIADALIFRFFIEETIFSLLVRLIVAVIINVLYGMYATGLYRRKAMSTVSEATGMSEAEKKEYLKNKGDVSKTGMLIFFSAAIVGALVVPWFL